MEEILKINIPGRKNLCSNLTTETPEQTVNLLKVYINGVRIYYSLSWSLIWDFEHVFSNSAIVWRHTNLFANQILIYLIYFLSFIEIVKFELCVGSFRHPANIYLLKLNHRYARTRCGMYSALVIKTPESSIHESFYFYDAWF